MEEIYEINQYFPVRTSDPVLSKYIQHHSDHLFKCVKNQLFTSAYTHLHILYMVFVYLQLLRISKERKAEFDFCWIGFPTQEKDFLKDPSSPFSFSQINEKTVFRFFRLVGFNDGMIGDISKLVNKRNNHLHANGQIFFEEVADFLKEIKQYLNKIKQVVDKQKDFLELIYIEAISGFSDDYEVTQDDIENSFSIQFFFSDYELKLLADGKSDVISNYINTNQ